MPIGLCSITEACKVYGHMMITCAEQVEMDADKQKDA